MITPWCHFNAVYSIFDRCWGLITSNRGVITHLWWVLLTIQQYFPQLLVIVTYVITFLALTPLLFVRFSKTDFPKKISKNVHEEKLYLTVASNLDPNNDEISELHCTLEKWILPYKFINVQVGHNDLPQLNAKSWPWQLNADRLQLTCCTRVFQTSVTHMLCHHTFNYCGVTMSALVKIHQLFWEIQSSLLN